MSPTLRQARTASEMMVRVRSDPEEQADHSEFEVDVVVLGLGAGPVCRRCRRVGAAEGGAGAGDRRGRPRSGYLATTSGIWESSLAICDRGRGGLARGDVGVA